MTTLLEYHYFAPTFKEAVEQKIDKLHEKLILLLKFTHGEIRETIKNRIQQPPEIEY